MLKIIDVTGKEELIERARAIMRRDDIIVKTLVPEYEIRTFVGEKESEIREQVDFTCGWHVWGFYVVESLSYASHVEQGHLVDFWTNHPKYSALVVFRKVRFKDEVVSEFRKIIAELGSIPEERSDLRAFMRDLRRIFVE